MEGSPLELQLRILRNHVVAKRNAEAVETQVIFPKRSDEPDSAPHGWLLVVLLNIGQQFPSPQIKRKTADFSTAFGVAGIPGLEPRTKEPETSVLPITPYPKVRNRFILQALTRCWQTLQVWQLSVLSQESPSTRKAAERYDGRRCRFEADQRRREASSPWSQSELRSTILE